MLRFIPDFYVNEMLWIKEGETLHIPGTEQEFYLTNHKFILEVYDESDGEVFQNALADKGMIVKNFQTNVTLYKAGELIPGEEPELQKIEDFGIQVNNPLKFDQFALYQTSYRLNEIATMTFALTEKSSGKQFGDIIIDLANPQKQFNLGEGYSVELLSYFPDFQIVDGKPTTASAIPNNPAFAFKMITPDKPDGEMSFAAIQETIEPISENQFKMEFQSVETVNYSALTVRKDLTLPIVSIGGIIFLIGVCQGSFWQHRRIWLKYENGKLYFAGHTNKNWFDFNKEIERVVKGTKIPVPIDQSVKDKGENQGVNLDG